MKRKKEFKAFLRSHGAFNKFLKNMKDLSDIVSIEILIKDIEVDDYVSAGFIWSYSPEGGEYWSKINKSWEKDCGV